MAKAVILIAGNICAGKTTLLEHLGRNRHLFAPFLSDGESIETIPEFIDEESRQLFYRNRKKGTFWFELNCLAGRIVRYAKAKEHKGIVVFDRGMIEGMFTFARNSLQAGYLSHTQFQLCRRVLLDALDELGRNPEEQQQWLERLIVYLRVKNVKTFYERYNKRENERLSLEYLQQINERYEDFMENIERYYKRCKVAPPDVLMIDASADMQEQPDYLDDCMRRIVCKMSECKGKWER